MYELIGSNQDLRQFTYITSHNLRAPIANLIGLLELLDYKNQSEEELNDIYLGLKKSGEQLHETISDLNEILIVRNKARTDKEWLRLDELIERLQQQVSCALEKEKVVWQFDFQQFPRLWFNRTYLEGILLNLITNSLKYRSNKRTLTIRIGMDKVGEELRLTFQDNGQGLDTERYKDRLFGLYQRFHNNTDSKGLGLFLAKTQLEALGGRIEAEGKVDEGLTLRLYFQDKQSPIISDPDQDQP
jgi:signal transduction histidine kinase